MPITSDEELEEALTLLESPEGDPELKKRVMRAVRLYSRAMPSGAPAGAGFDSVGIDAIESGRRELEGLGGGIPAAAPRAPAAAHLPPEPQTNAQRFDELWNIETGPALPPAPSQVLKDDPLARFGLGVAMTANKVADGILPGSGALLSAGADKLAPGAGEALEASAREHHNIADIATMAGASTPFGLEGAVAKGISGVIARPTSGLARKVAGSAVGSGVSAAAGSASRDVAEGVAAGNGLDAPDLERAVTAGIAGTALGGGLDALGAGAGHLAQSNRKGKLGPEIERFERAGGKLSVSGLKPSPDMKATQAEVARIARDEGRVVSPLDVQLPKVTDPVARAALKRQTETVKQVGDETAAYHQATEDVKLDTEPLLRATVEELKGRSFQDGGLLPGARPSTGGIRKDVLNRLVDPELVPRSEAERMRAGGAMVMNGDELERIGLSADDLASRATVRGGASREVGQVETEAGAFLDQHPLGQNVRNFLNVDRRRASMSQMAGDASQSGEAAQAALEDAVSAGHVYPGRVYRGARMNENELAQALQTGELNADRIWSVSPDESIARQFASGGVTNRGVGGRPVLFEIEQNSAVPVSGMSGQNTFGELLIPQGRRYRISNAADRDGALVLSLQELGGGPGQGQMRGVQATLEPMDEASAAAGAMVFGRPLDQYEITKLIGHDERLGPVNYQAYADNGGQSIRVVANYQTQHGPLPIVRTFRRDGQTLIASQDEIRIPRQMRGTGIGKSLLAQQIKAYDANGVSRVEMTAADEGRAVWPLMGFELSDPTAFQEIRQRFDEYLVARGVDPATVPVQDVRQLARYKDPELGVSGFDFLKSSEGPQYMDLSVDLSGETGQRLRNYLGIGRGRSLAGDPLVNDAASASSASTQASTSSMRSSASDMVPSSAAGGTAGTPSSSLGIPDPGSSGGGYQAVLRSRQMNPRELDEVASNFDTARKVESSTTSQADPFYDRAASEIRKIRDTAPMVKGVADESHYAESYDAEGNLVPLRGYSALKANQSRRLGEMKDEFEGAGLPRELPRGKTRIPPGEDMGPLGPGTRNEDPEPDLSVQDREKFNTRVLDYERTPGMEKTRYEPLRKLAEAAGVRKELDKIPGLTAWQHLSGKSATGQAVKGVISGSGVSGYVTSGAADFARLRLDSLSDSLGGVPATMSDAGVRKELAKGLSQPMLRLLKAMRSGKTATGKKGDLGTQILGLRGGPAGARVAATLTDEDLENLKALVLANQAEAQPEEETTE